MVKTLDDTDAKVVRLKGGYRPSLNNPRPAQAIMIVVRMRKLARKKRKKKR